MLDLFDGQVNEYSKLLAPKTTLTRICVKSVRYKDQECTEKYGLNVIFKGILTHKQKKTTTPSRKCCQLIFSSLSSYSTHKRRTLSSCETTAAGGDFPPPECQLFYICSTMQLVDLCEFETGNHPLLTFWKAPACTTRWLKPTHSSGGSAELHDACLEAMRSKAFLFRFHFQDLHLLLGLKPFML